MASLKDAKNSLGNYFRYDQIEQDGPVTLTIKSLFQEPVRNPDGEERELYVLSFKESPKKIVLNATRTNQLVDLLGEGDPAGQRVQLTAEVVKVNNRAHPMVCLREAGG
jgi:hypothetical protein